MTTEEFFSMTEEERSRYMRNHAERLLRLRYLGFKFHELQSWDWDNDEGLWDLWEKSGLEIPYRKSRELAIMKDQQQRAEWYRAQWIN